MKPRWVVEGEKHIGQKEIKGSKHNPFITHLWILIKAPYNTDETPWCAGYVGGMLEKVGIRSTRSAAAISYMKWGRSLSTPVLGCIVVLSRQGGNHVGFYMGTDKAGRVLLLGGNQGDKVSVAPFAKERILGYRWPKNEPLPGDPTPQKPKPKPAPQPVPEPEPQPEPEVEVPEEPEEPIFWRNPIKWLRYRWRGASASAGATAATGYTATQFEPWMVFTVIIIVIISIVGLVLFLGPARVREFIRQRIGL